jgi:hypothetical protein
MSEYGGNKGQKVQWMIDNVGLEPSAAITQQATTDDWLCSGKDGKVWTDFKISGLDALWNSLPDDDGVVEEEGEVQEPYQPVSPAYSPNEPGQGNVPQFDLGGAAPMQQGMSKEGTKEGEEPVLNFAQINPNVPFNPPPTSTAVIEAGASNDDKVKRAFSSLRIGMQAMLNQRGSADDINARQEMMADITSFGTPQRYFDAANNVFLCLTGRTKPAVGQVTATEIEAGQGPQDLTGITPAGFTTFVVSQGPNYSTVPIEQYGCYPMLSRDLIGDNPPQTINAIELQGDANARYVIQLPMSHEGGGVGPNDPTRETRLNVCFFMNPEELQSLMEVGLFHHLEYYSENFMPTFLQRYNILRQGSGNNFRSQVGAMMQAVIETFTTVPAFSAYAAVQQGNPDAMYLYMSFKFYVTKIMQLTNELTALNTKMASQVVTSELQNAQETLYKKLLDLIYEMDVWNFIIQTVPDGKTEIDVGFWNFSAFGISRTLRPGQEILASYKNGTKPWGCYPRFLYQTFFQLKQVEQQRVYTNQKLDQAVDAAVALFNASNPSALDLIRFGNTQSVLRYAFLNRDDVRNLSPAAKLQMLTETYANKEETVGRAMHAQNASNSILAGFIARAAGMTPATFLQLTGQEKSALRAQRYIQELGQQRQQRIPAFNVNDIIQLPNQEQQQQIESTVGTPQFRIGMSVASQAPNPRIIIKNTNNEGKYITYTYKRLDAQGREVGDDQQIPEYFLLGAKENVAKANQNLVLKAIHSLDQARRGVASVGLAPQDAARILGARHFQQSDLSIDIDVAFYNAKLEEMNNRELFDSDGNATADARRADGVTLMMAEQLRAQQQQMRDQLEILKNKAQLAALTEQQGQEYWSDKTWQQEYYYQKYLLYKKKFKALQKSWNLLASLDQIQRAHNGDRPPLPTWSEVTVGQVGERVSQSGPLSVSIRVINTGWCLAAFDLAARVALPASLANMAQQLRTTVFGSAQTLAQTWNNGRLLSFGEWATIDSELSNRAQTEVARQGKLLTPYNQEWYDEYVAFKEAEKQRVQDRNATHVILDRDDEGKDSDADEQGDSRGSSRRKRNEGSNNNQGGGRRKKKTKSKYNKMGGRKKKTRKKRGGAGCKSKKDCTGNKMCLPGGTQNIEGGEGQCVPKPVFVSHMKSRGQEKRDERAAAKQVEQPEVDLSSLPEEPSTEETIPDVPVTPGPEKTEETATDVPVLSGNTGCKSKKDCTGNKMCLPGGTQNIEGGEGQCVPKPVFVSHMKARGQEKHDERAAAKQVEQPEADLSGLPEEPSTEETTTDVPVTPGPEKTEETTTDVPVTPGPEKIEEIEQPVKESQEYEKAKKEAEEKLSGLSPQQSKEAAKKALENMNAIFDEISTINIISPQSGSGKRKKRKKRKKTKRRKSKRRKSKKRRSRKRRR